jgi:hypothetical protein
MSHNRRKSTVVLAVMDPSSCMFLDVELESMSDLSISLELDGINGVEVVLSLLVRSVQVH